MTLDLSTKQKDVILHMRRDKYRRLKFIGIDARKRPVVSALVGVPATRRTWAIKRDGDPTDPAEPVTKLDPKEMFGAPPGRVV